MVDTAVAVVLPAMEVLLEVMEEGAVKSTSPTFVPHPLSSHALVNVAQSSYLTTLAGKI